MRFGVCACDRWSVPHGKLYDLPRQLRNELRPAIFSDIPAFLPLVQELNRKMLVFFSNISIQVRKRTRTVSHGCTPVEIQSDTNHVWIDTISIRYVVASSSSALQCYIIHE